MIGYVTLGTNDLERGAKFYDKIAALLDTRQDPCELVDHRGDRGPVRVRVARAEDGGACRG